VWGALVERELIVGAGKRSFRAGQRPDDHVRLRRADRPGPNPGPARHRPALSFSSILSLPAVLDTVPAQLAAPMDPAAG
jgi:hypothetical protein